MTHIILKLSLVHKAIYVLQPTPATPNFVLLGALIPLLCFPISHIQIYLLQQFLYSTSISLLVNAALLLLYGGLSGLLLYSHMYLLLR